MLVGQLGDAVIVHPAPQVQRPEHPDYPQLPAGTAGLAAGTYLSMDAR